MSDLPPPPRRLPFRWNSVRTRLTLLNVGILALLLSGFGLLIQYSVRSTLMTSVDRDLFAKSNHDMPHPPPPGERQRPDGPQGPGRLFQPGPHQRPEDTGQAGSPPGPGGPRRPAGAPDFPPPENTPRSQDAEPIEENAPSTLRQSLRPHFLDRSGHGFPPFQADSPWDADAYRIGMTGQMVYTTIRVADEPVRVLSRPLIEEGGVIGVYQSAYPLREVDQAVTGMNRALLTLIPVILFLAGLGGAFLADRALRPVRRLSQSAERIGAEDLSRRLPVAGEDEFAELSTTFNGMLERLEMAFGRLEALITQKQHLIEQQRRFTADASHELRTPLTVIKANTSLNLSGSPSPEEYHQSMEDIDRAASTMTRLVLDLLLLARADEEQLGRNRMTLPLLELLQGVVEGVRRPGSAPITVQAEAGMEVFGNPDELARVFSNLLENASRHTPPEGQILVTAYPQAGHTVIAVADTGSGIAPEHLPHLGERFYRADAARTRADGGTGLGLAICRSIVEAHGGTLALQSEPGKGTTVTVTL